MADNDFYSNSKVDGQYWTAQDVENVEKGFELLEDATASILEKDVSGGIDVTLTSTAKAVSEERYAIHVFTGTLTGNINIIVSTAEQVYRVFNNTSGAYTLTMKTSAGTGITIPQGEKMAMYCDGTNVVDRETAFSTLNVGDSVQIDGVVDEDDMVSDSPTKVATQQSTKKYIDDEVGAVDSDLTAHLDDTEDAHDASAISSVAVGNVTSQDVQSAIEELDTQDTDHAALTEAHGATGAVMGTTNTQTVTNKTLDALSNLIGANHIHVKVRNTTAGALGKGTVVKATGYNLGQDCVEVAATAATSDVAFGVLNEELAVNTNGLAVNTGVVESVDTSSFSVGNKLYSDGAGSFTTTKPSSGLYQTCAFVLRSHANNGRLFVEFTEQLDADGEIKLGHITVSQAVDLDAIEASADVTDTANVTASGALMDSEVTNLAQVKAFDTTDYATSTQGTTADNALPLAGGTMTGNITLGTNTIDGLEINTTATNNLGLGTGAVDSITTGDYNVGVGDNALTANTTGYRNTASGYQSLYSNTTGNNNTASGYQALKANTTGLENVAVGQGSLYSNTTASYNTAVGRTALYNNTTGGNNAAVGAYSLYSNTTASYNSSMGVQALFNNSTGNNNTANGYKALYSNTTGLNNTANGYEALYSNTTANNNTASGYRALRFNTTGNGNVANGIQVLYNNTTGANNTAVGYNSLQTNTTGANNTSLGYAAGDNITTGSSNIIIGAGIDAPSASASNQLNIGNTIYGNTSTGKVGVGTTSPTRTLHVNGNVQIDSQFALYDNVSNNIIEQSVDTLATNRSLTIGNATYSDINIKLKSSGNLRLNSGSGGIQFNGDTASANALDDYEEGTWTPSFAFGGASVGMAFAARGGNYTKVGNIVTATCRCVTSSKGTSVGTATLTGLPFTAVNNANYESAAGIQFKNINFSAQGWLITAANTTTMKFTDSVAAGALSSMDDTNFINSSNLQMTVTYQVA